MWVNVGFLNNSRKYAMCDGDSFQWMIQGQQKCSQFFTNFVKHFNILLFYHGLKFYRSRKNDFLKELYQKLKVKPMLFCAGNMYL